MLAYNLIVCHVLVDEIKACQAIVGGVIHPNELI